MKLNVYDTNKKLVNTFEDYTFITTRLLSLLFSKYVNKATNIKRITRKYDYKNTMVITFTFDNGIKYEFANIPAQQGYIDECEVANLMKGGK